MTQRVTRQRTAILEALAEADEFRSAQQWHESLARAGESIGLATVYRNLQALAESGEVDQVMTEEGQSLYRLCGDQGGHHHHLRCRVCGAAVEIEGPGVEEWAARVAAQHGYTGIEHTIELTGLCAACSTRGA